MASLAGKLIVAPGSRLKLGKVDADETFGLEKAAAAQKLAKNLERLSDLQYRLYAEARRAVLVVLQGIDAAGKDGTIRHVMTGLNPQGVRVTSFKVPEGDERRHDYLWRIHRACPEWGSIGIFNRSHYEDVLVVRVHDLVPKSVWSKRYRQINEFERTLSECGVTILKFLLYISKEEQAKRFRERLDDPSKNWKFSEADTKERSYWDNYLDAYDEMLDKCSTDYAPWHVIPSNRKWFRNLAVSEVIVHALERMKLKFPEPAADLSKIRIDCPVTREPTSARKGKSSRWSSSASRQDAAPGPLRCRGVPPRLPIEPGEPARNGQHPRRYRHISPHRSPPAIPRRCGGYRIRRRREGGSQDLRQSHHALP